MNSKQAKALIGSITRAAGIAPLLAWIVLYLLFPRAHDALELAIARLCFPSTDPAKVSNFHIFGIIAVGFILLGIALQIPVYHIGQRRIRAFDNYCVTCGYDNSSLPGKPCPECGTLRPSQSNDASTKNA